MANYDSWQGSPDTIDRNIRYLYLEILFASILGAIIASFNSAFAIHLGASDTLIALLTSAPALLSAVASIPAARYLATRKNRRIWLWSSLFLTRFGYLVVALMPILIRINTATWLVIWIIALNLPGIFFGNGFQVLLFDLLPENKRAFVVARRQVIYSIGLVIITALAGAWLDSAPFPLNYELLYGFGFVTVLGSHYYLNKLVFPENAPRPPTMGPVQAAPPLPEPVHVQPPIRRFLINMIVYQFGLSMPGALFNIYYINSLHASDGWLGINGAAGSAGVIVGYIIWERLLRRHTYSWAQQRASLFTWVFPVAVGLIPNLYIIALANFLVNVMHSGVDLSNFNVLVRIARPHERMAYVSWFNTVVNISAFVAPLLGTWMAISFGERYGIQIIMIVAGTIRFAGGLLFNLNRVEKPVPAAALARP